MKEDKKIYDKLQGKVVLGLGSNRSFLLDNEILEPLEILKRACLAISKLFRPNSFVQSSVIKTKAMYYENQDDFYNMIVLGDYDEEPEELLKKTQEIEAFFGRDRTKEIPNGPRSLDIDIELFYDRILNTPFLTIPHPRIKERDFVLRPLLEIFPDSADPISGQLFKELHTF